MKEVYAKTHRPLPAPLSELRFDAIFVFNDPRDWALDIQIIIDALVSSGGVLGTYSPRNGDRTLENSGWQSDSQPTLYFSNSDLLWSTPHPQPRLAQGAFQAALAGVWLRMTQGRDLRRVQFGKPSHETYLFAQDMLIRHHAATTRRRGSSVPPRLPLLRKVYMVGDNPESDIQGANQFQSNAYPRIEWHSILVQTGVWRSGRGIPVPMPRTLVHDVCEAVRWALTRESWPGIK